MRTKQWVFRCIMALVGSATVVAAMGVFEYFMGESSNQWLDPSVSDIRLRVSVFFENPNVLSVFIVMVLPFVLASLCTARYRNERVLSLIISALFVLCIVFTWSRGAWLAAIISTFIFFIIYNKKTFRIFGVALFVIPIIPIVMPSNVLNRFLSIADLSDSSISYRIYTWRGTVEAIKAHFFSGIGYGNEAFKQVYPQYAYSGMEAAEHSHSLFLQLLLGLGIVGLVIFALITFFALQKLFGYIKKPEDRTSCVYVIATVASLISALIMGVFDNVWYNYRIFYAFWVIVAIGVAFVRVGSYEMDRKMDLTNGTL